MVGKPVSEKTRSKKSSNLVNGKIRIPKNVGTTSASSGCTCSPKVTKKKSRNSKDSDIAITPSYISESDNVKVIDKVKIGEKSLKGKKSGEKNKGTKRGLQKNRAIGTLYSESKPEKKKKKKVRDEDVVVVLEELNTTAGMKKGNNNEGKKEDGKLKGKEAKVKSPEKSKKGNGVRKRTEGKKIETVLAECKNDSRKKRVEEEKERTGKRRNEDENTKEKNKKRRTEVEEGKKQMKERGKQLKEEGAEKEKKQKKVEVESKKVKKKKNKEEEIVMEEENNVLYQFPMAQVSRMIKSEEINSKIAHEAVFVINKASEKFLELFCREAYACAFLDHKNQVAYNHLASVVSKRRRFDFLSDFIPQKVKAEDALAEMSKAEAETDSETT